MFMDVYVVRFIGELPHQNVCTTIILFDIMI